MAVSAFGPIEIPELPELRDYLRVTANGNCAPR
jgi:hypothetical protein